MTASENPQGGASDMDAVQTFAAKRIKFDIIPNYINPVLCGRDLEAMMHELRVTYNGRYKFIKEERLARDARGQAGLLRRWYDVYTEVST